MDDTRPGAERRALERILATPELAQLVPQLRPETLHRVIQTCGLEECGELLALATPAQLRQLCDLDLWRPPRPGQTETFDAARFGAWLEVMVETSPGVAAKQLAELDRDVVTTGLAEHVRVFERAAIADYETTDGELISSCRFEDRVTADLGGYVVVARRRDAWDAIVLALTSLETDQSSCFRDVMDAVRRLSNSTPERDGLHDLLDAGDQLIYEASADREARREEQGYVAVGEARAFLRAARSAQALAWPASRGRAAAPLTDDGTASIHQATEAAVTPVVNVLIDAGILEPPRRALLAGAQPNAPRLKRLRDEMQDLVDRDAAAYEARNADLAFLANTLVAGCSVQGRAFAAQEAWDAAVATCNLGLERLAAPDGFLADNDLIRVFQTGWTILHDDVVMYAADRLAEVLTRLLCRDRFLQAGVDALHHALVTSLRTGTPWQARSRMDVLASLDTPAWTALLGLIDECPVQHAVIGAARKGTKQVSASAFEFISDEAAILEIRTFLQSLDATLV